MNLVDQLPFLSPGKLADVSQQAQQLLELHKHKHVITWDLITGKLGYKY